jgi:pimeloyl-ACP methyl ester carboxylesterase
VVKQGDAWDQRIREAELSAYRGAGVAPRERILDLDDGRNAVQVRVTEFGSSDGPELPVLLLHGIASPSSLFAPLVPYLGTRYVVVVDWPGHGLSGELVLGNDDSPRRHAVGVLRSLLDALEVEVVDVVAHSMGAQFALYGCLGLPARIRRVVTLGAPGAGFEGVAPVAVMKLLAVPRVGRVLLSLPMSDKAFRRSGAMSLGPGVVETLTRPVYDAARLVGGRRANAASIAGFFRSFLRRGRVRPGVPISPAELDGIGQPVLLVWGDRDVFLTPEAGAASAGGLRNGRLMTFDAGHAPWLEHEQEVGEAIAAFLAEE